MFSCEASPMKLEYAVDRCDAYLAYFLAHMTIFSHICGVLSNERDAAKSLLVFIFFFHHETHTCYFQSRLCDFSMFSHA